MTQPRARPSAVDDFAALDLRTVALLLDVDGTLIDLGPSPMAVHVPETLRGSLARLVDLTGGALALVSGRPIADLDFLFKPLVLPAVGGHGAEIRVKPGELIAAAKPLPERLRRQLTQAATPGSGVVIEDKGYSLALHYRNAPREEARLRALIAAGRAAFPAEVLDVLPGKAMFEVKRPDISKGSAVRVLMGHAPFVGRRPVFIGDDVTDESVFAVLPEWDGKGFSVGRHLDGVIGIFATPGEVREALQRLATNTRARAS